MNMTLKRTGFKKPTYKEAIAKKQASDALKRASKRVTKKKGTKRRKKSELQKLKAKLWEECKRITRRDYGNVCYTCGQEGLEGSNWHTGHFVSSSICSVYMRYHLDNLRPQCYACNIHKSGNWIAFEAHLRIDGIDVEALKQKNEDTKGEQYDVLYYQNKLEEYKKI